MIGGEAVVVWVQGGSAPRRCRFDVHCTVGRSPGSRILIPDAAVSRDQAVLELTHAGLAIRNISSANVIRVAGRPLDPGAVVPLSHGDAVSIGSATLTVESIRLPEASSPSVTHLICVKPDCRRKVSTDLTDCPWCGTSMAFAQTSLGRA